MLSNSYIDEGLPGLRAERNGGEIQGDLFSSPRQLCRADFPVPSGSLSPQTLDGAIQRSLQGVLLSGVSAVKVSLPGFFAAYRISVNNLGDLGDICVDVAHETMPAIAIMAPVMQPMHN